MNILEEIQKDLKFLSISLRDNIVLNWYDSDNFSLKTDDVVTKIINYRKSSDAENISTDNIKRILSDMELQYRKNEFLKFKKNIEFDSTIEINFFQELLKIILPDNKDRMYEIILRQVIWTIKRRLYGLSDYCPIFVSVYGKAGSGKSEFLKSMFSIMPSALKSRASNANELFNDERQSFRFVENYVIIMDELTGLDKSDLNKLKNRIDEDKIVFRQLGFNKTSEGRNNAQLIGTSNTHLSNTLTTDVDIRKWAEIQIHEYDNDLVPQKMVEPLHKFDWLSLWKSINQNEPSPFQDSDVYNDFVKWTTEKCKHSSTTTEFIEDCIQKYDNMFISADVLQKEYDLLFDSYEKKYKQSWPKLIESFEKVGCKKHRTTKERGIKFPSRKEQFFESDTNEFEGVFK
jgi:energy-coupling factor transporter ATP-binding protein EcfA2